MTLKHAYLIMAHNEFDVLKKLISTLDSSNNDIFIHFDKRVKRIPELSCNNSRLAILDNRVKSIWGDVSLADVELRLLARATREGHYDYYHIISGTHFPIKSLENIDAYYAANAGKSIMMPMETSREEIEMKIGKRHFFILHLVDKRRWLKKIYHFLWLASLRLQKGRVRDTSFVTGKASQWCSITDDAARALVDNTAKILNLYKRSFCCDEIFMRSFLEKNGFPIEFNNNLTFIDFVNTAPRNLTIDDFETLKNSTALFARKMTGAHIEIVDALTNYIRNNE